MKKVKKSRSKVLFWLPRVLTILFILFISMFALDVFSTGLGLLGTIIGLFMHLIPTIILTLILVIFWRKSAVLGGMWIGFGIWYIAMMLPNMIKQFEFYYLSWIIQFSGIAFVVAWLFFLDFKKR